MALDNHHFLVTGASGPTGSWVIRDLIDSGARITAFDRDADDSRLRLIHPWAAYHALRRVVGDVADVDDVSAAMEGATHVIHITRATGGDEAATTGMRRIVGGALSVMEAAGRCGVEAVAYDVADGVLGVPGAAPSAECAERTLFECAVTAAARRLWASAGIPTQGIRVGAVYGAGHNEGWMTTFTEVIAAAVRDAPLVVAESTPIRVSYAADVARALVEGVRRASAGAGVTDLPGHELPVAEFVSVVRELTGNDTVSVGPRPAPLVAPDETPGGPLLGLSPTPIRDGVRSTLEVLRWAPESLYSAVVNDPGPGN